MIFYYWRIRQGIQAIMYSCHTFPSPVFWHLSFVFPEAEFMNEQYRWGFWASSWEFSDLRFLFRFLKNQMEGVMVFISFPPFSFTIDRNWTVEKVKGCVSLRKCKSQGKAVEVTANSKEENSYVFCLDFVQEFGLCMRQRQNYSHLSKRVNQVPSVILILPAVTIFNSEKYIISCCKQNP